MVKFRQIWSHCLEQKVVLVAQVVAPLSTYLLMFAGLNRSHFRRQISKHESLQFFTIFVRKNGGGRRDREKLNKGVP